MGSGKQNINDHRPTYYCVQTLHRRFPLLAKAASVEGLDAVIGRSVIADAFHSFSGQGGVNEGSGRRGLGRKWEAKHQRSPTDLLLRPDRPLTPPWPEEGSKASALETVH